MYEYIVWKICAKCTLTKEKWRVVNTCNTQRLNRTGSCVLRRAAWSAARTIQNASRAALAAGRKCRRRRPPAPGSTSSAWSQWAPPAAAGRPDERPLSVATSTTTPPRSSSPNLSSVKFTATCRHFKYVWVLQYLYADLRRSPSLPCNTYEYLLVEAEVDLIFSWTQKSSSGYD